MQCPLCESNPTNPFWTKPNGPQKNRAYVLCENCFLVFVPAHQHLSLAEQKTFYDHHQNRPDDAGYARHLERLLTPLRHFVSRGQGGLDYGAGPGPAIAAILQKAGCAVKNYDPIYAPQSDLLQTDYDFVTCTEVAEHFSDPRADWNTLARLVKPGGVLGVMTQFRPETSAAFANWWYHRDATHVCFYDAKTLDWLARQLSLEILTIQNPVAIFRRTSKNPPSRPTNF